MITTRDRGVGPTADIAGLFEIIGRYWRLVLFLPLVIALLMGIASYLIPRSYRATTMFLPERGGTPGIAGALAGVAGQFGLQLDGGVGQPVRLYGELARSRTLLRRLLGTRFSDSSTAEVRTLVDWIVRADADSARRMERGLRKLTADIDVVTDINTGLVRLTLDAPSASVAASAANALVAVIGEFNLKTRQTKGRQRREFVELRMAEAGSELLAAENAMRSFLERNRAVESPGLINERARLERQIDIHQQVYLTLARELETARIEEVNDTPVLTVIDSATPPRRAENPKRLFLAVTAWALGMLIAITVLATAENLRRRAAMGDDRAAMAIRSVDRALRRLRAISQTAASES